MSVFVVLIVKVEIGPGNYGTPNEDHACASLPRVDMLELGFSLHWLPGPMAAFLGAGSHGVQRATHQ